MANTDFSVLLKAELDRVGIDTDLKKVQEIVKKYHLELTPDLQTASLKNQFKSVCKEMANDFNKAFNANVSGNDVFKVYENKARQLQQAIEKANKIQLSMGVNGDTTSQIEVLRNNFTKLGLSADEVKTKMSGVDTEVKTLQSLMSSGAENSAIVTQFEKLQTVLTQTQNNLKQTRSDYSLLATEQQRLSLANTIEAWNQKNTRATKAVREENERYVISLRDLNNQMTKIDFNKINTGFKQNENSMRALNRLGASLKDQMKQAANSFTQWISVSSAIMGVVYSTKEAVQELKEVDNILTEISKTSDMTSQELEKLGMSSYSSASKYGRTATDYLTGVQEMSRSGFYGEKGTAMAEQSLLAQSAGDMTSELANSYILATNAAFKYKGNAEKINEVLDGQNEINTMVSLYRNIWLHIWLLSWNVQRWITERTSYAIIKNIWYIIKQVMKK